MTDVSDFVAEQYADAENLSARMNLHEQYSTADVDFRTWQFDQFDSHANDADVLTVGCGTADLWAQNCQQIPDGWSITLTDFSEGMVEEARQNLADCDRRFSFQTANITELPFEDDSFDVVTANHMLYHVSERDTAIAELRRVLRSDGAVYATTNGEQNMAELYDVLESVLGERPARGTGAFTLQNGRAQLEEQFEDVALRTHDNSLEVTELEPVVAYVLSRGNVDESLASELHEAFAAKVSDGGFHVSKEVGMFVARP